MQQPDSVAKVLNDWHAAPLAERHTARPIVLERLRVAGVNEPETVLGDDPTSGSDVASPTIRTLAEIIADPAMSAPPTVVLPRLAWRGRVTLLAAREKDGKSTMATAGAAAVTRGLAWLGDPTTPGKVLWVGLEEHVGDLATRMSEWGADPNRVHVIHTLGTEDDPIAAIHIAAEYLRPALVVIDTLAALADATGARPDPGSATAWTPVMAAIARIARGTDASVLLLHHARRSDGQYRDSSAIGAGVDAILEMAAGADADVRKLKAKARWRLSDYSVRLVAGEPDGEPPRFARYDLVAGAPSLDAQVLRFIDEHPGCSMREVRDAITGRATEVGATVRRLVTSGAVVDRGTTSSAMRLHRADHSRVVPFPKPVASALGTSREEAAAEAVA